MKTYASPRPRAALLALTLLGLVALPGTVGAASPAPTSPAAAPDGEQILLQMDDCCGFWPQTLTQLAMPTFTLYGDGRAIYRPASDASPYEPPPLSQAQLSPAQVDDLIGYALGPGGLAAANETYDDRFVTDQSTTSFLVDADGVTKTVSVYALGFPAPEPRPFEDELARLAGLSDTLSDFDAQVAAGHAESSGIYEPSRYLAYVNSVSPENDATAMAWPVADVALKAPGDMSTTTLVLTPDQVAQITTVPTGGVGDLIYATPDGGRVSVTIRPMLPTEVVPET